MNYKTEAVEQMSLT